MIWQIALVALPIYMVTWRFGHAALTLLLIVITSLVLKFTWYDHLKELEHINEYRGPLGAVRETHPAGKL
jgi:hypothetical protein